MHFLNNVLTKTLLSKFTELETTTQTGGLETRQTCT